MNFLEMWACMFLCWMLGHFVGRWLTIRLELGRRGAVERVLQDEVGRLRKENHDLREKGAALGLAVVDGRVVVCRPIPGDTPVDILKRIERAIKDIGSDEPSRPWHEIPKPDSEPHY